jgi:hypothetical protein
MNFLLSVVTWERSVDEKHQRSGFSSYVVPQSRHYE